MNARWRCRLESCREASPGEGTGRSEIGLVGLEDGGELLGRAEAVESTPGGGRGSLVDGGEAGLKDAFVDLPRSRSPGRDAVDTGATSGVSSVDW